MTSTKCVVGLIADTHGLLRPEVPQAFAGVDLIVHAGDVGGSAVLRGLAAIARVEAVYGNVDDSDDPVLAAERTIPVGGLTLHVSHGHELGRPTPERMLARYAGDILVFGHTHRAVVVRDGSDRLVINPGAAGPKRFDLQPSVARLTVTSGIADVEIILLRSLENYRL
ncbi:MAG: YfcE family phosphodiesterase [Acidobacteria bacterium]|nr:MAG: YfcE family phosphodiesterase [Acidobacteriota bacterium]